MTKVLEWLAHTIGFPLDILVILFAGLWVLIELVDCCGDSDAGVALYTLIFCAVLFGIVYAIIRLAEVSA